MKTPMITITAFALLAFPLQAVQAQQPDIQRTELVRSDELASAFFAARDAGKVGHLGISTHQNAQECLEAAIEAGHYSLAMIAICPAGWYDYRTKELLGTKGTLKELRPLLDRAQAVGVEAQPVAAGSIDPCLADHPFERDAGQIVVGIAAAHVRMHAREPDLRDALGIGGAALVP